MIKKKEWHSDRDLIEIVISHQKQPKMGVFFIRFHFHAHFP